MTTTQLVVKVHQIASDGLPDMNFDGSDLIGRVAFIFDGSIVTGWPLDIKEHADVYDRYGWDGSEGALWEADSDVGHTRPFGGVTHWVEFPLPLNAFR